MKSQQKFKSPLYQYKKSRKDGGAWRGLLATVAGILILVAVIWWTGFREREAPLPTTEDAAVTEVQELRARVKRLEKENAQLLQQVAVVERSSQIDSEASNEEKRMLNEMEQRLMELNEELSFYKSIVSPSKMAAGIHVQQLVMERGEKQGQYLFKLVLTQVRGNNRVARGKVQMYIEGRRGNLTVMTPLSGLTDDVDGAIKFAFKYFHSVEGGLEIPEDFVPSSVKIEVEPTSSWLKPYRKSYNWQKLVSGET